MRIAIVDDLETERAQLKTRLARQLRLCGAEAELLEFESGESFLAAEKEQRFTAAFLDIYMHGMSGMDAAKELRKTDADCLLVFTTTSTDHALEGFQVRALHYLVKPFSEEELSALLAEMLARLPRPEPVLTVKVSGSDVRLCYRDIISAEHFAHLINIRTTALKTLVTRQSFKVFTEPLKKRSPLFRLRQRYDRQFRARRRFSGRCLLHDRRQQRLCQSGAFEACPAGVYGISAAKGAYEMKDSLRPILELLVVLPGLLLGYFPVKTYLKQSPGRLAAWLFPLMACLCIGSGLACYRLHASTVFALAGVALAAICLYTRTLTISLWKSGTIALAVCAVFACVNSLSRAVSAAIIRNLQLPPDGPWLCLGACVFYNAVCWGIVLAAYYPATHTVRAMVEDDNFAQTWYVFWVLPLAFILLNLFMIPRYQSTLQTGRVLQGYIVLSSALLVFMFCFNAVFLLMATSLNRNAKLQQENQFLSMQQQRYENLRTAIEEARQARHDMRHQFNQISALADAGDLENLKSYLAKTVSRIPNLDMCFCENRAADSVVGYYCAMAKRDEIPFRARLDLPETLPVDEIDMCLVLSNLLENALEASLRTAPGRRQIEITACVHADRILLIEVKNAFDGEVNEKNGVFRSSKRRENGIGIQSVTHIAEKTGGTSTFTYQNGTFSAKVMLCG